ncbi:MAG: DegQ family serine endoprotease [Mariprofundaceae bacterium]|nr:DegQ family serine endoprotease [Mariprofundaceae bacterium]
MKILKPFIVLMILMVSQQAQAMPSSFADLVTEQRDTVVNISTTKTVRMQPKTPQQRGGHSPFDQLFRDFFGQIPEQERHALGTGFILSSKGYVVTNNHVIDGADEIIVKTSDGKEFKAELIGNDAKLDVALLKIKAKGLQAVKLADSDKLRVGDWVVAIGNPFGLEQTVTAGIVSARGRVIGSGPYDDFIQTDAAINPGNSGGPLFNRKGELVGINTAIYSRSGGNNGIGFAIPINLVHSVFDELRKTGHVQRARLGVMIRDVDRETMEALGLENKDGALVPQVQSGSAADKAGIQAGDVIIAVDNTIIKTSHDLPIRIARLHPGDKVMIHLIRDGKKLKIPVTVEKMPDDHVSSANKKHAITLGLELVALNEESKQNLDVRVKYGLVVRQVQPNSPAARAGIKRGDVLHKVNGHVLRRVSDLSDIMEKTELGGSLKVLMDRHGNQAFSIIRLPKDSTK